MGRESTPVKGCAVSLMLYGEAEREKRNVTRGLNKQEVLEVPVEEDASLEGAAGRPVMFDLEEEKN